MALFARPTFLAQLKALYPPSACDNPWYIVAAVGFAAANRAEAIPLVFQHAMKDVDPACRDSKLLLVRRMRDAIFKAGLITGYSRAINGLKELYDVTPEDLRDTQPLRDTSLPITQLEERGREVYKHAYGDIAENVQSLLDNIYPDMGWFSNLVGYGLVYSYEGVVNAAETSYALVAALVASDTPRQTDWHLNNARRNGATLDEVKAVRAMAIEVAKESGVVWKNEIPDIE